MINPLDLLTREQLADVKQRSDLKGIWVVAFSWMMIFGAMAMFAIWPNPLTFIAAMLIIGTRQLGLAIGMRVRHSKFGEGTVLNFDGSGAGARVEVNFKQAGHKWLMLAYARLDAA